jgi:hypothetical protein
MFPEELRELAVSEHCDVNGPSSSFADRTYEATHLPEVSVSDNEDIDVAVRPAGTRSPRAVDCGCVYIRAIEGNTKLLLNTNRTTK